MMTENILTTWLDEPNQSKHLTDDNIMMNDITFHIQKRDVQRELKQLAQQLIGQQMVQELVVVRCINIRVS